MPSFQPVETVEARADGAAGLLLVCDHASNAVPPGIALGLSDTDMARHIAWDVGARGVTLGLADRLGAGAVLSCFSRLVIDPNRGEDDPTLVMKLYDGSIIPGNRHVDRDEIDRRLDAYYRPYHDTVADRLLAIEQSGGAPAIVSVHSFTPAFHGRPIRPWHVGLLWDRDDRLVRPLLDLLRAEPDLFVGDNEPYSGQLAGDCMWQHGTRPGRPHVLIEIRNDLIETAAQQAAWVDRLAPMIAAALARIGS